MLLGLFAAQWRRYPASQVFVFDAGRSIRALTLGLGGAFVDLLGEDGMGASLALQPLARIDEETERAWACDWLVALLSRAHVALDTSRKEEIWRALGVLCERPQTSHRTIADHGANAFAQVWLKHRCLNRAAEALVRFDAARAARASEVAVGRPRPSSGASELASGAVWWHLSEY